MVVAPHVSVVVPAYNVRSYIEQGLTSLDRQSFQEFEVLIVDDGSTDDTAEVVRPFKERDSRFQLLHKHNGGLSLACNYGLRHARTPLIALLDGNEAYEQDKLATHSLVYQKKQEGRGQAPGRRGNDPFPFAMKRSEGLCYPTHTRRVGGFKSRGS